MSQRFGRKSLALFVLIFLNLAPSVFATTRTWTGNIDKFWNTNGNWSGGGVPGNGDTLVFPASATRFNPTNDQSISLIYASIETQSSSYVIDGAVGAKFLQTLRRLIENPLLMVF